MEIQFSVPLNPALSATSTKQLPAGQRGGTYRFALDSRARHTRRSSTRARTGCKKRHVKCDETKPACLNCIKWRGYCEAYIESEPASSSTLSPSASRNVAADKDAQLIHTKRAPLLLTEPDINSIRFSSSDQRAYFNEWIDLSVKYLSGGIDQRQLWMTTMPQVTMEETTLRFGAMAVGALRKAYQTKGQSAELGHDNRHYLNSVIYYCEALRLQSRAEPTKEGLRTALLSSLLFICFEAQRGNMPSALKHVSHGFSMLNELAACTELAPDLVSIAPAPPSLVQEILDCYRPLELQSRSFLDSYKQFLYPPKIGYSNQSVAPDSSEQAFAARQPNSATCPATASVGDTRQPQARIVASSKVSTPFHGIPSPPTQQSMPGQTSTSIAAGAVAAIGLLSPQSQSSDPETPPLQHHSSPKIAPHRFTSIAPFTKNSPYFRPRQFNITTLDNLPATFRNLEEARGYWSLIQKFTVSHLPLLTLLTSQLCLARAVSNLDIERKLSSVKKQSHIGNFVTESHHWLSRWMEAFKPVYKAICREATAEPQNYLSAMSLRVEYLILCIYSTIPRFSCLTAAKGLTPRYREINRLAEILLRSRPNCGFAMDSGWTWPLFISSFSCRDPDVRQDAIRILGQYPVRNALRDSYVFRAIALRNQEAENQVLGEETEEEQWLQLRRRELVFEDLGSSIIFRSAQKNSRSGQWELIEEIANATVLSDGRLDWRRQPVSESASIMSGVC
ncbi:hypothetical protein E4U58_007217 [Claviceps cyperi]|nr:hypothetical protein E4U58_007217 [Claviceps cyperi]